MLVLGRNLGDTIVINDNIVITVFESNKTGDKFKIAIDAPKEVKIQRGELCDKAAEYAAKVERLKQVEIKRSQKQARKFSAETY